jgi:hypothetical protein
LFNERENYQQVNERHVCQVVADADREVLCAKVIEGQTFDGLSCPNDVLKGICFLPIVGYRECNIGTTIHSFLIEDFACLTSDQ